MKRALRKYLLSAGIAAIAFLAAPTKATAQCDRCASGWEVILTGGQSWCKPVLSEETGVTQCRHGVHVIGGAWCTESGVFCSTITVGGGGGTGGGSGGGSGGGNSCQTSGYCPPECFSCSGSGGRPAT